MPIERLAPEAPTPPIVRYAYRSLDRQYCLADNRLAHFPRPALWRTMGARQLVLTSLLTGVLGEGPAAVVTSLVPDLHHFRGSFGGKHVLPLWRDAEATKPNVTRGLLGALEAALGLDVAPEELLAYCYAVLSAPTYTVRFAQELEISGPRVPLIGQPCCWFCLFFENRESARTQSVRASTGAVRSFAPWLTTAGRAPSSLAA